MPVLYARDGVTTSLEIGEYWDQPTQIDVVGVRGDGWIDIGECKWGTRRVGRKVLTDLIDKTAKVVPEQGKDWTVHYALFARAGFTESVVGEAERVGAQLIELEMLGKDLSETCPRVYVP